MAQIQLLFLLLCTQYAQSKLQTIYQTQKLEYLENYSDYIPENNILGQVRVFDNNCYVSVPRWRTGVPATLNILENSKLSPYPDLKSNIIGTCSALQNVAALEIQGDNFELAHQLNKLCPQ